MRLISQDREKNLTYDSTIVSIHPIDKKRIVAHAVRDVREEHCFVLDDYSTPEKAAKVMSEMWSFYIREKKEQPIFFFPKDDEVEATQED